MDMKNADAILIMGSNMAECHPVAFRWVLQAKTRAKDPCVVMHADPRFTRTSAMADVYAPVRAGSDIVFLGALVKHVLDRHVDLFEGLVGPPPKQGDVLKDRNTVFQVLLRHYARYTPEMVEQVCGTPREVFLKVAQTLYANSGPDRTSALCYAVGWTQHTTGVQMIRTA